MINIDAERIIKTGIALSTEKDYDTLLELILSEIMDITNCDAGTLYTCSAGFLNFKIMRNDTLNIYKSEKNGGVELPPVLNSEENVCAYASIHKTLINIEDVTNSSKFDFSGPERYDKITGYHTRSMLVIPLENNKGQVVGVLQLINAKDKDGNVTSFDKRFEPYVLSIGAQAAVAMTNMKYVKDIKELFQSFVEVFSTAIDERTPYNANHSQNMVKYGGILIDYINEMYENGEIDEYFDTNRREQFITSIWLHDIGKLITPISIMNKSDRLSYRLEIVMLRFDKIKMRNRIDFLEHKISEEVYRQNCDEIQMFIDFIKRFNKKTYIDEHDTEKINALKNKVFQDVDGEIRSWITDEEIESLEIRNGTLTEQERKIMENHVVITGKLLNKIRFSEEYENVAFWAKSHHEFLDGSGYPNKLSGDQIPFEVRLLTGLDIFEALTAGDRPYRPSMSFERVISILNNMVSEGKIDGRVVDALISSDICRREVLDEE